MQNNPGAISVTVNYEDHQIEAVSGVPEGTQLRLREWDANNGWLVNFYEVREGLPVFVKAEVECLRCGGSGEELAEHGGGSCVDCGGSGYEKK